MDRTYKAPLNGAVVVVFSQVELLSTQDEYQIMGVNLGEFRLIIGQIGFTCIKTLTYHHVLLLIWIRISRFHLYLRVPALILSSYMDHMFLFFRMNAQKFVMDQTIIRWQLQRCKKVGACTDILLPKNKLKCLFKGEIPLTSTGVCGQRAWKGSDTFPALSSSGDVRDQKKLNMWHLKSSFSIRHTYMQECCIWMSGWYMCFLTIEKLYGSLYICLTYQDELYPTLGLPYRYIDNSK